MSEYVKFLRDEAELADAGDMPDTAAKLREIANDLERQVATLTCECCYALFTVVRYDDYNDPPRICPWCGGDLPMPVEEDEPANVCPDCGGDGGGPETAKYGGWCQTCSGKPYDGGSDD